MAYSYDYGTSLTVSDINEVITTNNVYSVEQQTVDYTHTSVVLVVANSEVQIQLPGINYFIAVTVSSDGLFDVALAEDNNLPRYTGMFSNNYTRITKNGTLLTTFFIKASTEDVEVKYTVVGKESL